jgi:Family of unknown function (DUF6011)
MENTTPTPAVNRFANLYALFQYAVSQNLKYPKIKLQFEGETVVVKLAGAKSRYNGQLMVTNDAGYGSQLNKYFGRVDQNGAIVAGPALTAAIEGLLEEFATNPVEVATRYGKLTGNCMFCDKHLDDPTSVATGYGPVCAKKWNLPHSAARQSRKASKAGKLTVVDMAVIETRIAAKQVEVVEALVGAHAYNIVEVQREQFDGTEDYNERTMRDDERSMLLSNSDADYRDRD